MENLKKIGLILLFLAFTAGVGFLLFTFFFGGEAPPEEPEPTDITTGPDGGLDIGLPTAGDLLPEDVEFPDDIGQPGLQVAAGTEVAQGGVTRTNVVERQQALSPTVSPTGGVTYYNQSDGRFYSIGPDGEPILLSNKTFPAVEDVTWAPETDKAIIEFPDSSKVIYDFETETQTTIPSHWEDFSFASDGDSFAAKSMGLDPENRWLIAVDSNGSNARLVEHLGTNADKVTVNVSPDSSVLALSETGDPVGFDTREILLIGPNNENFKALRIEGFNMASQWSPSGEHLLYSTATSDDGFRPSLWIVGAKGDSIGENRTKLSLNTTAEKCTFLDEFTIYCAVPSSLPEGVGLQPELMRDINEVGPDSIFRIDLRTGRSELVGIPDEETIISRVVISEDEGLLFFQDALSLELRSMRLR